MRSKKFKLGSKEADRPLIAGSLQLEVKLTGTLQIRVLMSSLSLRFHLINHLVHLTSLISRVRSQISSFYMKSERRLFPEEQEELTVLREFSK